MHFSKFHFVLLATSLMGAPTLVGSPALAQNAFAQDMRDKPFLHALFSDNAVLQRDRPIPIWGWTAPGTKVTVQIDDKSAIATTDTNGRWMARIGPYPAGGPHTLKVTGSAATESATRQNILFGDVWLCSGQSNMEMGIARTNSAPQEIANANHPQIRLFTVPHSMETMPQTRLESQWLVCTPENIAKNGQGRWEGRNPGFSAVAYYFGRELNRELSVPIGLIQATWGGTVIEAWISESALGTVPDFKIPLAASRKANSQAGQPVEAQVDAWLKKNDPKFDSKWATVARNATKWKTTTLPSYWDAPATPDLANFNGIGLFRREVMVPESWAGHELTVSLGAIDDRDVSYWNGAIIGTTDGVNLQRKYTIPGAMVKAGRNIIGVRVFDVDGPGGMTGPANAMRLSLDAANSIPLDGRWEYRASLPKSKMPNLRAAAVSKTPNRINVLYNGMIAPLEPFGLKGAIWYQGESNATHPEQYGRLLPTMIGDWRKQFASPLSFHIVQLAAYTAPDDEPRDEFKGADWPGLRAAQQSTVNTVPNTGIAITTDIGEAHDIHPRNKQSVGLRLALSALAKDYGKKVEFTGPVLKSATPKGAQIELFFEHSAGGLSFKGESDHVFAIAGVDRVWAWATPQIDGAKVTLTSPHVTKPVYVRYAWSNYPRGSLYNGASLPAPPFQTTP